MDALLYRFCAHHLRSAPSFPTSLCARQGNEGIMVSGLEGRADLKPSGSGNLYSRRFTIEGMIRDIGTGVWNGCSLRFGWSLLWRPGLLAHHRCLRRPSLHTSGAAGEALGMSRLLKANTVNPAFTLVSPGQTYLQLLPACPKSSPKSSSAVSSNYCFSTPKPQNFSPYCSQCPVEKPVADRSTRSRAVSFKDSTVTTSV